MLEFYYSDLDYDKINLVEENIFIAVNEFLNVHEEFILWNVNYCYKKIKGKRLTISDLINI